MSDESRAKTVSALGSALCTSNKTSHKDSFGLPRHCALHHAAKCHLLNKTTQTMCRQGYTAWRIEERARGKRVLRQRNFLTSLFGRNHDDFCPEMAAFISEVFKMD